MYFTWDRKGIKGKNMIFNIKDRGDGNGTGSSLIENEGFKGLGLYHLHKYGH